MATVAAYANAQESDDMGPAAFLWPPDRAWAATEDNIPPCGSSTGVGNRTSFPLSMLSDSFTISGRKVY